jgi:hypothetical protein
MARLRFDSESLKVDAPEDNAGIGSSWANPHIDRHASVKADPRYGDRSGESMLAVQGSL